jgi:hypothetical protein
MILLTIVIAVIPVIRVGTLKEIHLNRKFVSYPYRATFRQ